MGYPENGVIQKKLKNGNVALLQSNDTGVDKFCLIKKDGSLTETTTENITNIKRGMVEHLWKKKRTDTDALGNQSFSEKGRYFQNGELKEEATYQIKNVRMVDATITRNPAHSTNSPQTDIGKHFEKGSAYEEIPVSHSKQTLPNKNEVSSTRYIYTRW